MKVKSLEKKIGRLRARIAKDTKKLGKLQEKLAAAKAKKSAKSKSKSKTNKPAKSAKAAAPAPKKKKKRQLSPQAREQLAERMRQRWAAKRAAEGQTPSASARPGQGFVVTPAPSASSEPI
jgi:hypothetical protein